MKTHPSFALAFVLVLCVLVACAAPAAAPLPPTQPPALPPAAPAAPTAAPHAFPWGRVRRKLDGVKPYQGVYDKIPVPKQIAYMLQRRLAPTQSPGTVSRWAAAKLRSQDDQVSLAGKFLDGSCPEEGSYTWSFDGKNLKLQCGPGSVR